MEDARWFGKILSDIDDEIWRMGQISRELKEYRKDIQAYWNDAASREIGARYFNPHEEDDQAMLKELSEQKDKLEELNQHLSRLFELGVQANMLSLEIESIIGKAQQEMVRAYANYDVHKDNYSISKTQLPGVYELVDLANSMGNK